MGHGKKVMAAMSGWMPGSFILSSLLLFCSVMFCCGKTMASGNVETGQLLAEPVYECENPGYRSFLQKNYVLFEVGQVHPLDSSADGSWLFALNSPLGCLEIYRVNDKGLNLASSVGVGLQPVSVRVRNSHEVWVVNNLSDNVSVIELSGRPRVKEILQVGDSPFDVAFAAKDSDGLMTRAYISSYARGQHHPAFEPHNLISNVLQYQESGQVKAEKLGMADLWVYDIRNGFTLEGLINPFVASLRSLAVSDDGKTVYAAGFLSGNQTLSLNRDAQGSSLAADGIGAVASAVIAKKHSDQWIDSEGHDVTPQIVVDLPDVDVIAVDATRKPGPFRHLGGRVVTNTNRQLITDTVSGAGSVLFSLAVDQNRLLLTGLDSHNDIALEDNIRGKATSNKLVVMQGNSKTDLDLDKVSAGGLDYSLPLPGAIHVGNNYIYVAGFGSSRIGLMKRSATGQALLPAGFIQLQNAGQTNRLEGMGPAGITELPDGRVVVLSRLDNALHVLIESERNSGQFVRQQMVPMFTPESPAIVQGRRFLYDADNAGNGKMACASCHIFGDTDGLVWDLGSAMGQLVRNDRTFIDIQGALIDNMKHTVRLLPLKLSPEKYEVGSMVPVGRYNVPLCHKGPADELHRKLREKAFGDKPCVLYVTEGATREESSDFHFRIMRDGHQWASVNLPYFHALKGPLGTQTLFGLANVQAMHHRGDRTGSEPSAGNNCPSGNSLTERAFKEFNQPCDASELNSFTSLLGGRQLETEKMDSFTDFALQMHFPPNPHRPLDNRVPAEWDALFNEKKVAKDLTSSQTILSLEAMGIMACGHCHTHDASKGHFGGRDGRYYSAPHLVTQDMVVPDFRTFYRKLGFYPVDYRNYFYGLPGNIYAVDNKQVSALGVFHSAAFDPVNAVFNQFFFRYPGDTANLQGEPLVNYDLTNRVKLFYFLSMFDTDVFPVAGQQRRQTKAQDNKNADNWDTRYCHTYGFSEGHFYSGKTLVDLPESVLTCYPVLQAKEDRQ